VRIQPRGQCGNACRLPPGGDRLALELLGDEPGRVPAEVYQFNPDPQEDGRVRADVELSPAS
jgi:hypothetical protein